MTEQPMWAGGADSIALLTQTRRLTASALHGLTEDQLLEIPAGRRNNIAWNIGHLVTSQQRIHYGLSGLELHVPMGWVEMFKPGTEPGGWSSAPDLDALKERLAATPDLLADDLRAGRFVEYSPYTTSTGVELETRTQADAFNHFHEGVHLGIILSIRKAVTNAAPNLALGPDEGRPPSP